MARGRLRSPPEEERWLVQELMHVRFLERLA
jgi:hypothetical protein